MKRLTVADMAELADAHGSGPCERKFLQVQVLLSAPNAKFVDIVKYRSVFVFINSRLIEYKKNKIK